VSAVGQAAAQRDLSPARLKPSATYEYALAEYLNGSSWTVESTPNPSGEEADNLLGISCPSATDCTAVGAWSGSDEADAQAYAEQWTS
jgi:hypothetical protein